MGALGTGVHFRPTRRLTTDCPRLPLKLLPRVGGNVVLKWTGVGGVLSTRVTRSAGALKLETGGTTTEVLLRSWPIPAGSRRDSREFTIDRMICPRCDAPRNILHWGGEEVGWGCRGAACLNLDFPVRHRERWCPAIRRRMKLLRKLTRYSPRGLRARAIRAQIAHLEVAMVASMRRVSSDLTKRQRRRKWPTT
jgi:hypothetical protein